MDGFGVEPAEDGPQPAVDARHILFVSGPFGPFCARLARRLRADGHRASRVVTNAGELYDWGLRSAIPFFKPLEQFRLWIARRLQDQGVTDLVIYGDSNPYCAMALEEAQELQINVHVLEQGYFRPHWVTLERNGVNGTSSLPRDPTIYRLLAQSCPAPVAPVPVGKIAPAAVRQAVLHYVALYLGKPIFPLYRAPYAFAPLKQALGHAERYLSGRFLRKATVARIRRILDVSGPIYLALLQRPGDSQLLRHSRFHTCASMIEQVIASFAAHAPADARILFKGHPLDHGLENHAWSLHQIAARYGVLDRAHFVDGGHLAGLVRGCAGVITVNSTAGLIGVEFGRPTVVLGHAIYDMPGLTHQGGLDTFWTKAEQPDSLLYRAFRAVVTNRTQVNGAYSTRRGIAQAANEVARRIVAVAPPTALIAARSPKAKRTSRARKAEQRA